MGIHREWRILALLPAYLEREGSSLVYMAQKLIAATDDPLSGTYLYKYAELAEVLSPFRGRRTERTLLLGVTFALLDLAEQFPQPLPNTVIMETGGMKGRRPEIVREELHRILKEAFHVAAIHSEYGMTELLSQAWSTGDGVYRCPPWMRVSVRDVNDPFASAPGRTYRRYRRDRPGQHRELSLHCNAGPWPEQCGRFLRSARSLRPQRCAGLQLDGGG